MGESEKAVDSFLLVVGTATGLANIEHILGIIILVIQLAWLVTKLVVKIVNTVKNNESLDTLDDDVGSVIGQMEIFKDSLNSGEEFVENERHDTEQK